METGTPSSILFITSAMTFANETTFTKFNFLISSLKGILSVTKILENCPFDRFSLAGEEKTGWVAAK